MSRIFIIIFAAISIPLSFTANAQGDGKGRKHFDRETFEAKRNAYIVAEVGLTPEEAAEFIPLCNELNQKKFEIGRECRMLSKKIRQKEKPTEAEYVELIDKSLEVEIEEAELKKEYFEKFKKILSPEKIYKYREAEYKFVREFMGQGKKDKQKK